MSIVHDFERAFNRQDVKALLDCFTEDASYHDNFYGAHSGQVGLRAMFDRMFHEGRDYAWKMDVIVGRRRARRPSGPSATSSPM